MTMVGAGVTAFFSLPLPAPQPIAGRRVPSVGTPVQFAVVARLLYSRSEMNSSQSIVIRVNDPDGNPVVNARPLPLATPDNPLVPSDGMIPTVVLTVNMIQPPVFGQYGIDIVVDGDTSREMRHRIGGNGLARSSRASAPAYTRAHTAARRGRVAPILSRVHPRTAKGGTGRCYARAPNVREGESQPDFELPPSAHR
jgi:hypothetical protein